jgi:hypothetical protein
MILLIVLIAISGYLLTGAFFCGLVDDDEYLGLWMLLWPVAVVIIAISRGATIMYDLAGNIREHFEKE